MKHGLAVLLCCAGAAFAQTKEAETPQPPPRIERPNLNLRLDNPASFANVRPEPKEESSATLPTLGADARAVPVEKPSRTHPLASPYPPDTNEGR
jgi:hypothetical protein